jgi:hypothetical protein
MKSLKTSNLKAPVAPRTSFVYFVKRVIILVLMLLLFTNASTWKEAAPTHTDTNPFFNYKVLNSSVERYDFLKVADGSAALLDAQAAKLTTVIQRVFNSPGFKTYELRTYGLSVFANKAIAFDDSFDSFVQKIEGGGVIAMQSPNGAPELRQVTQSSYYLCIGVQAQQGGGILFKMRLRLPPLSGVSNAEKSNLETSLAQLGEAALNVAWSENQSADQASAAEAKGIRKISDLLNTWQPGRPLPGLNMQEVLKARGFFVQKVPCNNFQVDENASGGETSNVRYFSVVKVNDSEAGSSTTLR